MRKVFTYVVVIMWAAVLLGGSFRPTAGAAGDTPQPMAGYPAPPLVVFDQEGKQVSLADYRGKAVFLNFWASWCPPCRMEMPEIQRLAENLPEGAAILTVSAEQPGSTVWGFLGASGYTFPAGHDRTGQATLDYQVVSLPTSLFISPEGVITARINGPLTYKAMTGYLHEAGR